MKHKKLIGATLVGALVGAFIAVSQDQVSESQEQVSDVQDTRNSTASKLLENSCVDLDRTVSVDTCTATAKIEWINLGFSMWGAVNENEISEDEIKRIIVPVMSQEKACQDFVSRRVAAMEVLHEEYGKVQEGRKTDWFNLPPAPEKMQNLAAMFSDMSSCYKAVDKAIMTSGSSALQEKAVLYRDLADQAEVVSQRFSAKMQP